ncbi:MAG: RDD family protein [Isosphaeraceae bacterium]
MSTSALSAPQAPIDTTIRLVTPERVTFQYPLAGPFHRACSYLIDMLIVVLIGAASLLASLALGLGTSAGMGLYLVILFVLYYFYGAICEALFNGQTVGKRALGLRVVSVEGVPITATQAVLRNLLWPLDGIWPFAYLPAVACMIASRRYQRLGDLAAGTMVIVEARPGGRQVVRPDNAVFDKVLPMLPASIPAGSEMSRALADYARTRVRYSPARREEIAENLAGPLRGRYDLPADLPADAILCAAYARVFLGA